MGNSIQSIIGKENIKTFKFAEKGVSTMIVATCCKSMLGVDHPEPGPEAFPVDGGCCRILCEGEEISMNNAAARIFECDWDVSKDPDTVPLPPTCLMRCPGIPEMLTSGFFMKFKNRTGYKAVREAGDISIGDLTKEINDKNGGPTIINPNHNAVHLKPGRGTRFESGVIREQADKPLVTIEYFEGVFGRADMIRFLFHKANVNYKYIGYGFPAWNEMKAKG